MRPITPKHLSNGCSKEKWIRKQAERVADFLAHGYMSHATPITLDVARAMGLNVVEGVPEKVYELFKTFAFTGQPYKRQP